MQKYSFSLRLHSSESYLWRNLLFKQNQFMLDIAFIREQPDLVKAGMIQKKETKIKTQYGKIVNH